MKHSHTSHICGSNVRDTLGAATEEEMHYLWKHMPVIPSDPRVLGAVAPHFLLLGALWIRAWCPWLTTR